MRDEYELWRRVVEGIEEIGPKYPWLNRVISLGLDRFVRRLAVLSAGNPVGRILDAGAGDGSLTVVIQSLARGSRHFLVMLPSPRGPGHAPPPSQPQRPS
jgi:ubiquinone/menaquinone biosynthesis C-methylase UbiE